MADPKYLVILDVLAKRNGSRDRAEALLNEVVDGVRAMTLGAVPDDAAVRDGVWHRGGARANEISKADVLCTAIFGMCLARGQEHPGLKDLAADIAYFQDRQRQALWGAAFDHISEPHGDEGCAIRAKRWAELVQELERRGVSPDDEDFDLYVEQVRLGGPGQARAQADGAARARRSILAELAHVSGPEIVEKNVGNMRLAYISSELEVVLQAGEKILADFRPAQGAGTLMQAPLAPSATELLERMFEASRFKWLAPDARTAFFTSTVRSAEFTGLWRDFLMAVKTYADQLAVAESQQFSDQEAVWQSGMKLAMYLSRSGYAATATVVHQLQDQLSKTTELLKHDDIRDVYGRGASDVWQLVDQIMQSPATDPSFRHFQLATYGAIIVAWLATHADALTGQGGAGLILDPEEIKRAAGAGAAGGAARGRGLGDNEDPSDAELVVACRRWLALAGVSNTQAPAATHW